MSNYYDEPESSGPLNNPRVVTGIVLAVAGVVAIVGCIGLYILIGNPGNNTQATVVVNVTSLPSLTPSLTAIPPTETLAATETPEEGQGGGGEPTPDYTQTFAALPSIRTASISELKGLVQIRLTPEGEFQSVLQNVSVQEGATILTSENSAAKVTTTEGSIIRVSSQTQFSLTDFSGAPNSPVTKLTLDFGKVWTIIGNPLGTGSFAVDTPIGTAEVIGSWMGVEHNSTEQIDIVTCLEGSCRYSNQLGVQEFKGGQQLIVRAGEPLPDPEDMDTAQLAGWNLTRVPEVITLTATATNTGTPTNTRTPVNTRPPSNTPDVVQTGSASNQKTSIAATNTALAGSNSLTQAANAVNQTSTKGAANLTATVFFFNATSTAFYNSTQNSFTSTAFAFTATSFGATSNAAATGFRLTGTAGAIQTGTAAAITQQANDRATASATAQFATNTAAAATATELAKPYLNFDSGSLAVSAPESSGKATLTIRLNNPVSMNVPVAVTFIGGSASGGGTMSTSVDYDNDNVVSPVQSTGMIVIIPANSTSTTFDVLLADDGASEGNETIQVQIACSGSCPGTVLNGANRTSTITIVESGRPSIGFSSGSFSANENGGAFNVTVNLSRAYANVNTVNVNYSDLGGGTATANTCATPGADYTTFSGSLSFAPGETSKTFPVTICDDLMSEATETINMTLSVTSGNANNGTLTSSINIVDNDPLPAVSITNVSPGSPITEPNSPNQFSTTPVDFTIQIGPSGQATSINYGTTGITASQGTDYQGVSGTINFPASVTSQSQTVTVNILGDQLHESSETFSFGLSSPVNATLGTPNSVTYTINDDGDAQPTFDFSAVPYEVFEGNGGSTAVTITVNLDRLSGQNIILFYSTQNGGTRCTSSGVASATGGEDFTPTNGSLSFAPGTDLSKTFVVQVTGDTTTETNECIGLNLTVSAGDVNTGSTIPSALVIKNDD